MKRFSNSHLLIALLILLAPISAMAQFDEEFKNSSNDWNKTVFADTTLMKFHNPLLIKIKAGTVFRSRGSRLVVAPQGIPFGKFSKMVSWELGLPGTLKSVKDKELNYDFDMMQSLQVNEDVVLKIERVNIAKGDDDGILLVFKKGSQVPEMLQCGQNKITKRK